MPRRLQRLQRQSREEQRALQDALLRRYVREYLVPFSPHYRELLQKSGVRPEQKPEEQWHTEQSQDRQGIGDRPDRVIGRR